MRARLKVPIPFAASQHNDQDWVSVPFSLLHVLGFAFLIVPYHLWQPQCQGLFFVCNLQGVRVSLVVREVQVHHRRSRIPEGEVLCRTRSRLWALRCEAWGWLWRCSWSSSVVWKGSSPSRRRFRSRSWALYKPLLPKQGTVTVFSISSTKLHHSLLCQRPRPLPRLVRTPTILLKAHTLSATKPSRATTL